MLILFVTLSTLNLANLGVCYKPTESPSSPFIIRIGDSYYAQESTPINSYISTTSRTFVSSTPAPESFESSSPVSFISSTYYDSNYLDHSQSHPSSDVKLEFNSDGSVDIPAKYEYLNENARYSPDHTQAISFSSSNDFVNTYVNSQPQVSVAVKSSSDGKSYVDPQAQSSTNTNQLGLGQDSFINSKIEYVTSNSYDDLRSNSNSQLQPLNPSSNNDYNSGIGSQLQTTFLNRNNNYGNGFTNSQNQYLNSNNNNNNNGQKKTAWVNPQTLPLNGNNNLNNLNNFNNLNRNLNSLNNFNSGNLNSLNNFNNNLNNKNINGLNSLNNLNYNNQNPLNGKTWVNPQAQSGVNQKNGWVNPQLQSSGPNNPLNNNFNNGLNNNFNSGLNNNFNNGLNSNFNNGLNNNFNNGLNGGSAVNVGANSGRINFQSQNVNVAFNSRLGSFNYVEPQPEISADTRSGLGSSNYVNLLPQQLIVNSDGEYSLDGNSFGSLQTPPIANAFAPPIVKPQTTRSNKLEIAYQWRYLDWVHPTIQLTGRNFTVGNPFSQDVDLDRKGRVFVASPQWLEGTPVTLSVITNLRDQGGPLLTPYPDWTWHRNECSGLISVFRISIDECNRLWMVDTGVASGKPICPMKILAFDLRRDELLHSYTIPDDQTEFGNAQYVNPLVEVGESCEDTYVYVADIIRHGMLIYNLRENRSWRLNNTQSNAFGDDPEARTLNIAGESVTLNDGILGMSLSPKGFFSKRYLYFNSLASYHEKFADVDTLKRSFLYEPTIYKSANRRLSQAGPQAMSRTGAIFFQLAQYTAIACWNIERPFTRDNIVVLVQDEQNLQYVSGMKVILNAFGEEELWFNTNRLQKIINGSRRQDEINFRLIRGNVKDLIKNTKCEPSGYRTGGPSLLGWNRI